MNFLGSQPEDRQCWFSQFSQHSNLLKIRRIENSPAWNTFNYCRYLIYLSSSLHCFKQSPEMIELYRQLFNLFESKTPLYFNTKFWKAQARMLIVRYMQSELIFKYFQLYFFILYQYFNSIRARAPNLSPTECLCQPSEEITQSSFLFLFLAKSRNRSLIVTRHQAREPPGHKATRPTYNQRAQHFSWHSELESWEQGRAGETWNNRDKNGRGLRTLWNITELPI